MTVLLGGLLLAAAAGCATVPEGSPAPPPAAAPEPLAEALADCTAATGYDPDGADTAALGPFELGAGELAWRDCAYRAAADLVRPTLIQPAGFDAVLRMDREMTAAIAAGQATRAERERAVDAMLATLQAGEASLRAAGEPGGEPAAALRPDPQEERLRRELDVLNRLIR